MRKIFIRKRSIVKPSALIAIIVLAAVLSLWGANAFAAQGAVIAASAGAPSVKTEATIKAEKELDQLELQEKQLKEQITGATINRSKLLSQKRSDLRDIRKKRDDAINYEINVIKAGKERQTALIKELKAQLALAKKNDYKATISSLESSIIMAEAKLKDINNNLKMANDRLAQSYNDYKIIYEALTRIDKELKAILDTNIETEKLIKNRKIDLKNNKSDYSKAIKNKDFKSAERLMNTLVAIQSEINAKYQSILNIKTKVKNDYYQMIVNYKL